MPSSHGSNAEETADESMAVTLAGLTGAGASGKYVVVLGLEALVSIVVLPVGGWDSDTVTEYKGMLFV